MQWLSIVVIHLGIAAHMFVDRAIDFILPSHIRASCQTTTTATISRPRLDSPTIGTAGRHFKGTRPGPNGGTEGVWQPLQPCLFGSISTGQAVHDPVHDPFRARYVTSHIPSYRLLPIQSSSTRLAAVICIAQVVVINHSNCWKGRK